MLALLWLLYFSFGLVVRSASPLVTPMLRDLHMSYGQMGFVLGSWQLTYIAFAVIGGVIMDRWGIRRSILAGALVIGLSAALRAWSVGFVSLLSFVVLFGIGGAMISIGAPKTIALWFRGQERGMAVGMYTTGPWIGGMTALAATNALVMPLTGQSWRLTLLCYGGLTLVFAVLWGLLAREGDPDDPSERFGTLGVLFGLLRVRSILMILLSGLLSFAIMHGYVNWLPKILENAGLSPIRAGLIAAIPYAASILAVLTLPRWVPRHLRGRAVGIMAALAGLATVWVTTGAFAPILGLLLFGATGATLFPLLMLMLMDSPEVGAKYLGSAAGVFFCIAEMGGFLGPFVVGFLVDWTGGFVSGAAFLAGLGLAVFAMMFRAESRAPTRAAPEIP